MANKIVEELRITVIDIEQPVEISISAQNGNIYLTRTNNQQLVIPASMLEDVLAALTKVGKTSGILA